VSGVRLILADTHPNKKVNTYRHIVSKKPVLTKDEKQKASRIVQGIQLVTLNDDEFFENQRIKFFKDDDMATPRDAEDGIKEALR
jgi:hypothetical protein